ncbi:MAG: hypothetical protein JO319_10615 [Acidobacteriaceae bacterium]|nr:hypothetical protein [Acidobacteriaceae bacterium]
MSSSVQPPAEYAFWQTPDTAITVVYSLPLFHEIDFVVNEAYRSIPRGGIEVGGLLFGRKEASGVRIEAFRTVECEHARGPSFVLSENDLEKLARQLSTFDADPELSALEPVGWFVSHSRSVLEMREQEAEWFNRFFQPAGSIAVLAKPERFQPTRFVFLIRGTDGQMLPAGDPIILPLAGARSGAGEPIPSLPAPRMEGPSRAVTPPTARVVIETPSVQESRVEPLPVVPVPAPVPGAIVDPVPATPLAEAAASSVAPPPSPVREPIAPIQAGTVVATNLATSLNEPTANEPTAAQPSVAPPISQATPPPDQPTRIVSSRGIETRPLNPKPDFSAPLHPIQAVPEGSAALTPLPAPPVPASIPNAFVAPPATPDKAAPIVPSEKQPFEPPLTREPRPTTVTDEIWRQRVEALPLRPAPPLPASPPHSRIATDLPPRRRREAINGAPSRFKWLFLLAALLGCCVGYFAYLQLPAPVIPLTVRPQATGLVVSWPAAQTQNTSQATIQVGTEQPLSLSPEQRASGEVSVPATGDNIRIELVARHWPRDSRGIVRFIRSGESTSH